jgi:hypothetical protein
VKRKSSVAAKTNFLNAAFDDVSKGEKRAKLSAKAEVAATKQTRRGKEGERGE